MQENHLNFYSGHKMHNSKYGRKQIIASKIPYKMFCIINTIFVLNIKKGMKKYCLEVFFLWNKCFQDFQL